MEMNANEEKCISRDKMKSIENLNI